MLYFSLFMICAGLTLPRSSGECFGRICAALVNARKDLSLSYYFLLWLIVAFGALIYIFTFGVNYVNWPRLIPLTDAIEYEGPGIRLKPKGRGLGHPSKAASPSSVGFAKLNGSTNEVELGRKQHVE